jgi:hypothetical protein
VSESTEMAVKVYEKKDNGNLRFKEKLSVYPVFPDNLFFEPVNGEVFVTGPVDALHFETYKRVSVNALIKGSG